MILYPILDMVHAFVQGREGACYTSLVTQSAIYSNMYLSFLTVQYDDIGLPIPPLGEGGYKNLDNMNQVGFASDCLIPQSTGFTKQLSTISERIERTEQSVESRP